MIPRRELDDLRGEWSLNIGAIEKDYVLGWLLAGVAAYPELSATWIFKGGTCLRKCYYETFRFSEDLDFTVIDAGPEEPSDLHRIFADVGEWLQEAAGIELVLDDFAFRRRHNRRGHPTTQGRISHRGPNPTRGVLPKVKFDLTSDESSPNDQPCARSDTNTATSPCRSAEWPATRSPNYSGRSSAPSPSDAACATSTTSRTCTAVWTSWDAPPPSQQCCNANANTPASTSPQWNLSATPGSAGANRLRVEIEYRPEQGRSGPRVVEPYSLRRTSEGHIVLFVINDRRQLRSYRIDRIAGIKPTTQTFTPIRRVEF